MVISFTGISAGPRSQRRCCTGVRPRWSRHSRPCWRNWTDMSEGSPALRYALITPAWNEEAHLDELIRSVAQQTVLPVCWVIVSDGSTDRTDEIVRSAAERYPWIRLLRRERTSERHFAGKAQAVNAA